MSARDETAAAAPAAPLVVVCLRLPFEVRRGDDGVRVVRAPGGLVSALTALFERRGGLWVGWPGADSDPETLWRAAPLPSLGGVRCVPVELSAREVSLYYAGFANRTLWPLFHYFVARTRIDVATWRAYDRVNERFAHVVAREAPPGTTVWVHDYQLLLVPALLRRARWQGAIGFFLHTPFPAPDVLRVIPWSRTLVRGMLGADLVGFHAPAYSEHFLDAAERLLGCETDRSAGTVLWEGRTVSVQAHPLGVDADRFERAAAAAPPRSHSGALHILGVDRLDYTKGIVERLLAVERFLERYPSFRGGVEYTQVAVPTRERVVEYQALKREIDEAVGRINGRFSEPDWTPIRYLARPMSQDELAVRYRAAHVALVTPLRDGMNLVAKEYVAAQADGDGVLVLSELAGAAAELQEALLVNPFDVDAVAETLHRALTMPEDERRARMAALRDRVRVRGPEEWARLFVAEAEGAARRPPGRTAVDELCRRIERWLDGRPGVALFLDYDGTLAPLAPRPEDAVLPEGTRQALLQVVRSAFVDVTIVSGRALDDVRHAVDVEGLVYIGTHGLEIEGPGIAFRHPEAAESVEVVERAARELEALVVPGALVERKGLAVAFHVRGVAPGDQVPALEAAAAVLRRHRLRLQRGKLVVEGAPPVAWNKGRAVLHVLQRRHGITWPARVRALYIGDDLTDEDAFRSLHGIGRSVFVGDPSSSIQTAADFSLGSPEEVAQFLRWLGAGAHRASRS